jgi:tetraacyldisaccharide-1-P 4'-kinase
VLPAGPLRELPGACGRADAFLLPAGCDPPAGLAARPCFRYALEVEGLSDLAGAPQPAAAGGEFVCIAAIARPERFERAAEGLGQVSARLRFRDHAPWTPRLRAAIARALAENEGARPLLTEKDAARWSRDWDLDGAPPAVMRVRFQWRDPQRFTSWLALRLAG